MYKSIFMADFYQREKNNRLSILDVREVDEFQSGHIPSAQNLPLSRLPDIFEILDKAEAYYVICHSGGRSATACTFLSHQGFNVTNVMGGMTSWKGDLI